MIELREMIAQFDEWKFNRKMVKQRKKRGYSDSDCWGMDYWFCDTFVKMIRHLRDMKHGAPEREFEEFEQFPLVWVNEVAPQLIKHKKEIGYQDWEEINVFGREKYFDRWWFVLERIAWCLEQAGVDFEDETNPDLFNEYEKEYNKQVWGDEEENNKLSFKEWWNKFWFVSEEDEEGKPKLWQLKVNEPDPMLEKRYIEREKEIAYYKEQCKDEAFDLIKKYFYHLWD